MLPSILHIIRSMPQGQGQIMYFLLNTSSPKPLDLATSNLPGAFVTGRRGYWKYFVWP